MSGALILTGAPGSGKSSVLDALSTILEVDGVSFGAIETEELARGWPWLTPQDWLPQLRALIHLQRGAGRDTFLVVATTETDEELRGVVDAVAADDVLVVCLTAPPQVVTRRVAEREPDAWPGKQALVDHAGELARSIPALSRLDVVLATTDRKPHELAGEIYDLLAASRIIDEPLRPPGRRGNRR